MESLNTPPPLPPPPLHRTPQQEYDQQSLLHPALADTQGPSVCVVLPGTVVSDKQLLRMLAPAVQPRGSEAGGGGLGRPRMGNSVTSLFALTDCLQVA